MKVGPSFATFEAVRAGAKQRGCRRHCLCVLSTGQLWVLQSVRRRRQEGKKPVQLVGNRRERRSRPRGPRRAVLTAEETAPEPIDASACEACSLGELLGVRVQAKRPILIHGLPVGVGDPLP